MKNWSTSCAAMVLLAAGAPLVHAENVEAMLGNEFGELIYTRSASFMGVPEANASLALMMTEDNVTIGHATLSRLVLEDKTPLDIAIGGRVYIANLVQPDDDVMAIGFGASGRYKLPLDAFPYLRRFPVYVAASVYFAPEITTSGSGLDITDVHIIRAELELTPNIDGMVGIRSLDFDRSAGDDDIVDEQMYVGLRVRF